MSAPSWARNLTQGYGPTDEPLDSGYGGYEHFNKGYDYGLAAGTPVEANVGGTVVAVSNDPNNSTGWGLYVWVRDPEGYTHRYGHLSDTGGWRPGDTIKAGELIGKVGNTGKSTGPHLSYDVSDPGGKYIDPGQFVGGGSSAMSDTPAGWSEAEWSEYDFLRSKLPAMASALDTMWSQYQAGDTSIDYEEMLTLMANVQGGYARMAELETGGSDDSRAQQAFQNAITLGDYQQRQADSAYARWSDKKTLAQTMAEIATTEPERKNAANAALFDRLKDRYNYGQGPAPSTKTYGPVDYDEALAKYEAQLGVGPEPSAERGDYGAPAMPTYADRSRAVPPSTVAGGTVRDFSGNWADESGGTPLVPQASRASRWVPTRTGAAPNPFDRGRDMETAGGGGIAGFLGDALKNTRTFWRNRNLLPRSYAGGTMSAQAGPARVAENGPETIIRPDGQAMVIGGPSQMQLQGGEMIAPADVDPADAMGVWQIQQAAAQEQQGGGDRNALMAEAQMRAQDPELQQKVMALIQEAVAANLAANPPKTPQLKGQWSGDPWADLRPVSGVPPTNMPPEPVPAGGPR